MTNCPVCASSLGAPIYSSDSGKSITSLCEILEGGLVVYGCDRCGHVASEALAELSRYYDEQYRILSSSEEEDQILVLPDGSKVFRTDHQVEILLSKIEIPKGATILDFGCAKSSTLRRLVSARDDIVPFVFDVSSSYTEFWNKFVPETNQAVYTIPGDWDSKFDIVLSFFALEHVEEPRDFIKKVHGLLSDGGCFYGIVPSVVDNIADFVVADHVNHFTESSLQCLLTSGGFRSVAIDRQSHPGALVFSAVRSEDELELELEFSELSGKREIADIADYWKNFSEQVQSFEAEMGARKAAVYGSGFYGTYIFSVLEHQERVQCFLDLNPHRQNVTLESRVIFPPKNLPDDIEVVYIGLNPRIARSEAEASPLSERGDLKLFFP